MKKKMSNSKFKKIWIPITAVLVIVAVVATIALNIFAPVVDSYLGRGEMKTSTPEGTEDWDSEYYTSSFTSLAEAKEYSDTVSEQVTDEGIVLLKNNGVLPLKEGSEVSPFGYAYIDPAYSGVGAAATTDTDMVTVEDGLNNYFTINDAAINVMNANKPVYPDAAEGTSALDADNNSLQAMMEAGESAKIYEYDANIYSGIESDVAGTTGLVFIKRTGSEGIDKRMEGYDDGTPHYLALTQNEKYLISFVKNNCDNCVVILNTANPMELTPIMSGEYEADAIMWVGTTGSRGFESMSKILCGEVNPSGRLSDIYASDFTKDPTYANFGEYSYTNATFTDTSALTFIEGANKGTIDRKYVEYEEGIYVGYRYYETADYMDEQFVYGELDESGGIITPGAVAYPFGYGLSYTTFTQEITDFDSSDDTVNITVKVTNDGTVAGKSVVQIYYTSPYTEYDVMNGVEKSTTDLVAFAKTDILEPGSSETVDIEFAKEDMASYYYTHENADGTTGCYFLEAGEYSIELKSNSHDVIDSRTLSIVDSIFYEGDTVRTSDMEAQSALDEDGNSLDITANGSEYVAATNQFETMNEYMEDSSVTNLSRSNWSQTFPTAPVNRQGVASQVALDEFAQADIFNVQNNTELGNVEGSLVYTDEEVSSGQDNGLTLSDMRGLDYNDDAWDSLLDQIDWDSEKDSIQYLLYNAAYQTGILTSISKPATTDKDGAMGWSTDGASSWASVNLMASTWNTELLYEMGVAIGQEALQSGLNGWYAPAVNTHRSPFGGRAYEYFSEDGLLAGKLAAATVSGAGDQGVFSYLKHFALNDQETYRSIYLATWATEQAVREIYLKPFEICVKEAKSTLKYISDDDGNVSTKAIRSSTAIMSAQNCVGGTIGFAHYGLLTNVLRNEWGFQGAVVTDLYPTTGASLRDMTIRAGSDLYMNQITGFDAEDYDSPTARSVMRTAIHNIGYMIVNSNAMNGLVPGTTFSYSMSPWAIWLLIADIAIGLFAAFIIFRIVRRTRDEKLHPDRYLKKGEKRVQRAKAEKAE